jgi:hypothetical protein
MTLVLIHPEPDSANKMSRLNITAKERDDLISMLDKGFGQRVIRQTKAKDKTKGTEPPKLR